MANPNPDPNVTHITINLGDQTSSYGGVHPHLLVDKVIEGLMARIEDDIAHIRFDDTDYHIPVLPAETRPLQFLDVHYKLSYISRTLQPDDTFKMHTVTHEVVFRITKYDLYVVGFRVAPDEVFWEFRNNDGTKGELIQGSRPMEIRHSYCKPMGLERSSPKSRTELLLCKDMAAHYLTLLTKHRVGSTLDRAALAEPVLFYVQLTCEVARLLEAKRHVRENWYLTTAKAKSLESTVVASQNSWKQWSEKLQKKEFEDVDMSKPGSESNFKHASEVGIAKRRPGWKPSPPN